MNKKLMDFVSGSEKAPEAQFEKTWKIFQVKMNNEFHAKVQKRARQENMSIQALIISALEERTKQEIRE